MRARSRPSRRSRWAATLALGAALLPAALPAAEGPLPLLGHESVATVEGADAAFWNPAAIGTRYRSDLLLSLTDRELGPSRTRIAWTGPIGGLAVESEHGGPTATTAAAGGGGRLLRLGLSATRFTGGVPGERVIDWSAGVLARPAPWLSLGATSAHLGEPALGGATLHRLHTGGIGVRPLALVSGLAHTWGPRLTLSADLKGEEHDRRQAMRARLGAEWELLPGIAARGGYEKGAGWQVGFALLGRRAAYHGHAAFAPDGSHRSTTHALSLHEGEDRTLLAGRRAGELTMGGALGDDALRGISVFGGPPTTPVAAAHRALQSALEDPSTRGVLLDLRGISNLAQIEELRQRIRRLRSAGKPVVAYLEYGGGRGDLFLASACDRIVTTEQAEFGALGLRVERRSYRRALAELGLRIDRASVGAYKSAYRNFSVDSTPPADREAIEHGLDLSQELFVSAVSADRRMERARLVGLLDGRQWPAMELQRAGLVDSIGYREDAQRILGELCGMGPKPRLQKLTRVRSAVRAWRTPRPIAVVYASGDIDLGRSGSDLLNGPFMGPETLIPQLERAFRDPEVKAVVLRIESPGGSSLATDLIHHAVERLKRESRKPLIVSMGSVAASGGYEIALPGDRLFADQFTRTGSIGVLFVKPSLEGFYAKHQVHEEDFERGPYMGGWSLARDWDARAQAAADSAIRVTYAGFKAKVGAARRLPADLVEKVAQGRVWLGAEARAHGLVDEMGGLEEAIAEARRRAHVPADEKIELLVFRRPAPALIERLIGTALRDAWDRTLAPREIMGTQLRADLDDE